MGHLQELETKLGYTFKNKTLLELALTHPSKGHEMKTRVGDNQRLEFLGDAVLQLALTDKLYDQFKTMDEGSLTRIRAGMVNAKALEEMALRYDLGTYLVLGRGESMSQGRTKRSNLADAMEAVIGAVYLDSDFGCTRNWLAEQLIEFIEKSSKNAEDFNPKGTLQELLQSRNKPTPLYVTESETGLDHQKFYEIVVMSEGIEIGRGNGSSKKAAEMESAAAALKNLAKV